MDKKKKPVAIIEVPNGWTIEQQGSEIELRYQSLWRRMWYWIRRWLRGE